MQLLAPLSIGTVTARNRILFGPHVTNLGDDDRRIGDRHVAYYRRRAVGGCGLIVTEEASVHESDWPYERAPLAARCAEGWSRVAAVGHDDGALVVASLGHAGGQGSSAYSQRPLWAPSRVPEVNSREVPKWMEAGDIAEVVAGFAAAAKLAAQAGVDGVEVNAGQHSLVRQFLSGLTNHRDDEWGQDRAHFARQVLAAVRAALGPDRLLGLRLSCDELAPWAGITPEQAPSLAAGLADGVDYVVVVRGGIYSAEQTRPDLHQPPGFNVEVCRSVRAALPEGIRVFLQGSVVDPARAEWAVTDGVADGVEMTRAQIADPDLVLKLRAGTPEQRPPLPPLQPDLPGEGRPEPARHLRRRADQRARDRGPGVGRGGRAAPPGARRRGRAGWAGGRPGRGDEGSSGSSGRAGGAGRWRSCRHRAGEATRRRGWSARCTGSVCR